MTFLENGQWKEYIDYSIQDAQNKNMQRALYPFALMEHNHKVQLSREGLLRYLGQHQYPNARYLPLQPQHQVTLFSANDYLGLSDHPSVRAAAAGAAAMHGTGPRSSAWVCGHTIHHNNLEKALAKMKGTESALLLPTGFAANMSVMSALARAPCVVLSDQYNHASIVDGIRLASRDGVQYKVFQHRQYNQLETLLQGTPSTMKTIVVTDALFSMDGTYADMQALCSLRSRFGFLLVVDEAHSSLVCATNGEGWIHQCKCSDQVDVQVGTLSKAFAAQGGFIACSHRIRQLILNSGRAGVYSTALPLPSVAAAHAALTISITESWRRERVLHLSKQLHQRLGLPTPTNQPMAPFVALVVGDDKLCLQLGAKLMLKGIHVGTIRPPTVPPGTARLRVSFSASHSDEDFEHLMSALLSLDTPFTLPDQHISMPHQVEASGAAAQRSEYHSSQAVGKGRALGAGQASDSVQQQAARQRFVYKANL